MKIYHKIMTKISIFYGDILNIQVDILNIQNDLYNTLQKLIVLQINKIFIIFYCKLKLKK